MSESGQGAAGSGNSPGAGTGDGTAGAAGSGAATPWFGEGYIPLVQAKGWKTPDDALKSYADLEKHLGAPADRLIRLPDKPDSPEWGPIRARVGWAAPEKPDDYGIQVPEGGNPDYVKAMTNAFHKAGIPKSVAEQIATANNEFIGKLTKTQADQQAAQRAERIKAADKLVTGRFGAKAPQMQEAMLREAVRIGIKAEDMPALEADLADAGRLDVFRTLLADVAQARAEGGFHGDGGGGATVLSPEQAQAELRTKSSNSEWAAKALTRGTPEAEENIRLNALAAGVQLSPEEVKRRAQGLQPTAS